MDDLTFRDSDYTDSFGIRLAAYRDEPDPYAAVEAERLRRGADPFWARVFTAGELDAAMPLEQTDPWPVHYSGFRDDFNGDEPDMCAAIWAEFDREHDRDFFRENSAQRFRICTAFPREITAQGLIPLAPEHTAVRLSRWSPDDAIPLHREIEVRSADVCRINSASDDELASLFTCESGAHLFIRVGRCGRPYETDFDKRGYGNPLSIVRNPPRKIELQRSSAHAFNDCSELLNLTRENERHLPIEKWLIPGEMLSGGMTVQIAPGGTGKSARSLQLAVALARGDGDAMGLTVRKRTKVWVLNREDSPNQQRKRVAAICKLFGYDPAGLQGWVHIFNPDMTGTCLAKRGRNGEPIEGPDVQHVAQYILDNDIGAVIIDPLVGIHGLKESDNDEMRFLSDVLKRIARVTGAAIYLVHHSNKPSGASSEGRAGDVNSSRGASDITNAARLAKTMYAMPQAEAKKWGVPPEICHRYVRIDDAKANHIEMSGQPQWFEKVTVSLDNGESSFALRPVQLGDDQRASRCENLVTALLSAAIGKTADAAGKLVNFSPSPKARGDSNTALWLIGHGAGDYTVEEVRAALKGLEGLVIRVTEYKSGGKLAKRYELC